MPKTTSKPRATSPRELLAAKPDVPDPALKSDPRPRIVAFVAVLGLGVWSYWQTLVETVTVWEREPDYSHGYLVVPMAALFLWLKRKSFPGIGKSAWVLGLSLLACSVGMRLFASAFYFESIDGWSMLPWLAGAVAIIFGSATLRWSWTSIAFLVFMIPLPFRIEGMLSLPLQGIATKLSCWALQLIGQPAIAEGHTIVLGDHQLEVEQACSGLRLFMSILALACAYLILIRCSWWERIALLASVVPIALIANAARIVATGLLYQAASTEAAKTFAHDFSGWAMIPLAAAMFWLVLWYLGKLFQAQEQIDMRTLVQRVEM